MQLPSYLSLSRHNVYYFRFPLPKEIHPKHKSTHIRLSLSTSNEREAMYTSNMLTYHADKILNTLQSTDMNYEQIRLKITERLTQLIKDSKTKRLKEGELNYQDRKNLEIWQDQYKRYEPDDYYEGDTLVSNASRHISNMFDNPDLDKEQHKTFVLEFIRQYPEAIGEILEFNKNPKDINFNTSSELSGGIETPLKETIETYIAEQLRAGNWKHHTERERRKSFNALLDILGHDFITEQLTKLEVRKAHEVISALPINWRGNKKTRGLTIIQASKNNDIDKISLKTLNEYMGTFITFGQWLTHRGHLKTNPFSGMKTKIKRTAKPREAFTVDQVKTILNAIEDSKIKNGRKQFRYWAVLIAIYTGARREEICQMVLDDIVKHENVWCFDINDEGENKNLKTESSKRIIPIHQNILDKGFIQYIEKLKSNNHTRLFPELKYIRQHGYGRNLGSWFNETFLVELGLKTDKLVLHSLRHTITTQLYETGANDSLVKKIRGSSDSNDVTLKYYDHSKRINEIRKALQKLPY